MRLNAAVDARISELCKLHGITRYKLSMISGVRRSTLSEIKNCKTVQPSTIYDVCDTFEMTLTEFFNSPLFSREAIEE